MHHAYTAEDIRALEAPYVNAPDYDGILMRRAAYGLYQQAASMVRSQRNPRVLVLVGSGNNGGDGLYAAAHLLADGIKVDAYKTSQVVHKVAWQIYTAANGQEINELTPELCTKYTLIIDAVLGTGASGGLRGKAADAVKLLKEHSTAKVLACDIPSGIDGTSGVVHQPVLPADVTVTFIARKVPHLSTAEYLCGRVEVVELGIEKDLKQFTPAISRYETHELTATLRVPGPADHKYTRGVCGMITGSGEYPGAALLSTQACINTGVGMVRYSAVEQTGSMVSLRTPEALCFHEDPTQQHVQSWVLGSGATGNQREQQIRALLAKPEPKVIDAAAIILAAQWVSDNGKLQPQDILTPHAGELEQFFQWLKALSPSLWAQAAGERPAPTRAEIESAAVLWTRVASDLSGATVLLKGAVTHIASAGQALVTVAANSHYMATAGSGDVLAGIIGGLLAQEHASKYPHSSSRIAALACYLQASSARLINSGYGPTPASLVAQQVPAAIANLIRKAS